MDIKLTVQAGVRARHLCPVAVVLAGDGVTALTSGGQPVPCQTRPAGAGKCELRFLVNDLPAGAKREYVATLGKSPEAAGLTLKDTGSAIEVADGGDLLTAYHYLDPKAARPYWFPVLDPRGKRVTRAFPMETIEGEDHDHKHHRSLWVAYGDLNGSDNWSEEENCATQAHQGWNELTSGPVAVVIDQNVVWRKHLGEPVLNERRLWRFYHLPKEAGCLWDLEVDLTPAKDVPEVVFGDTKEGGLCSIRVATSMDAPKGRIRNSAGGVDEGECWGKRAHWCDYSGPVAGEWSGITIYDHPTSFRHPTWWHVRNYGLMTANCFGLSFFTDKRENGTHRLAAGETLHFRYRVQIHSGDCDVAQTNTKFQDYANPPAVKVG